MQLSWQKNYKGPVAECAFVAKSLLRERGEGKKSQEYMKYISRFFTEPQPRRCDCRRNGIRQHAPKAKYQTTPIFRWLKTSGYLFILLFILRLPADESGSTFYITPIYAQSSVLDLNTAIQDKKRAQRELQEKMAQYRQQIQTTQRKAASLVNQINILDSNITKTELEIKTKELEAEQLALEAQVVAAQIQQEGDRMNETRLDIAKILREMNKLDNRKYIEILLAEDSFSQV